jgi:hypothetical protein
VSQWQSVGSSQTNPARDMRSATRAGSRESRGAAIKQRAQQREPRRPRGAAGSEKRTGRHSATFVLKF